MILYSTNSFGLSVFRCRTRSLLLAKLKQRMKLKTVLLFARFSLKINVEISLCNNGFKRAISNFVQHCL